MSAAQQAWFSYRDAAGGLDPATPSRGALDEEAVDELLTRSDALGAALVEHLGADGAEERELAALQLAAAAAVDLDRANALAAIDDGPQVRGAPAPGRWEEIDRILGTPTEDGILAVVVSRGGPPAAATGSLKDAVGATLEKIAEDAGKAAGTTVVGLTGIPSADVLKALNSGVEKTFAVLGEKLEWLKRKAVALVLKAVRKLLAVFGTRTEAMRAKIEEWVEELDRDKVAGLMSKLYSVDALKQRYGSRLDSASPAVSAQRDGAARQELALLQAKWHKRTQVIDAVGGVAPVARSWIWALAPPWGALAYASAFSLATGYVVFAGGDYLDWREDDGILDLVPGVGSIVARAVAAPASA